MISYEVIESPLGKTIQRNNEDGSVSFIPADPANSDYQEYLNPSEAPAE